MNLICGVLLTLWVAGWTIASLRAMRLARVSAPAGPISISRDNLTGRIKS